MINSPLKILHYIAIIFLFGNFQISASAAFEYYMRVDYLREDYKPWPKKECSAISDVPVSPQRNSIVQIQGSPVSVMNLPLSPETKRLDHLERSEVSSNLIAAEQPWRECQARRFGRRVGNKKQSVILKQPVVEDIKQLLPVNTIPDILVEEVAEEFSDSGDSVSVTSPHEDVAAILGNVEIDDSSDEESECLVEKPKKKKKKGKGKGKKGKEKSSNKKQAQQSLVQLDIPQPDSQSEEVAPMLPLTSCPPSAVEVKFLYSDFGNLDANSDRAAGYVPLILYKLTINDDNGLNDLVTITRLTDKKGVHLFKISPNPYVEELTQADRVFSIAGRSIDFLLRNGNELYSLYERGVSENISASELQPIVETIVEYFKEQSLPAYRKLNVPEVKKLFPSEKKTMGNTYFSLQPPQGESFVVRTRQGQCWLMTQSLSLLQRQAFDAFKELNGDCPIGLVTTRDDQNFAKNADKFNF
jgi:hypothetical protein